MDYEDFKQSVFELTKLDLSAYKERQMKRRIDSLISQNGAQNYDEYLELIRVDEEKFEQFINFLTINVSEFYRDPKHWKILETEVVPWLVKKFGAELRIWSAACSTGDEPYSLVMALSRHIPLHKIKIFATDIDRQVIAQAKVGLYNEKSIRAVPPDFKRRYFKKVGASYQIASEIKSRVEFREHNLLRDAYFEHLHLIVCRNVLIYFTEEAKDEIYRKFNDALVKGGLLFIGSMEQIINCRALNFERKQLFLFQKSVGGARA